MKVLIKDNHIFWVFGFLLSFNFYVLPFTNNSPRATDLLSVLCLFLLFKVWNSNYKVNSNVILVFLLILLSVFIWFSIGTYKGVQAGIVEPIRWVMLLIPAYYYHFTADKSISKKYFYFGFLFGTVLHLLVIFVQLIGYGDLTTQLGFAAKDANFDVLFAGIYRPPGMYSHVNGSAATISLTVPLTLGLIDEKILTRKWLIFSILILFLSTIVTLNRASFIVSFIVLVFWCFFNLDRRLFLYLIGGCITIGIALGFYLEPPGGWNRWTSPKSIFRNLEIRWITIRESVLIIFENPLGTGSDYSDEIIRRTEGRGGATHNAWLQIALSAGLLLPLVLFISFLVKLIHHIFYRKTLEGWLAVHLFGLFLFEEFLTNMVIVFFTLVIVLSIYKTYKPHNLLLLKTSN